MALHITCLLIDDDIDDQEIFGLALQQLDGSYELVTADNASQGLELLTGDCAVQPDYIFLDLNMPRMSGQQCLQVLKKTHGLDQIRVIIYTTSSEQKDIDDTEQLGASHFLSKPASVSSLVRLLSELFREKPQSYYLNQEIQPIRK